MGILGLILSYYYLKQDKKIHQNVKQNKNKNIKYPSYGTNKTRCFSCEKQMLSLNKERYLVEYGQFIKYVLTIDNLKDKIFNLKTHDNFKDWLISKKETVLCGFSLVIFLLSFTFYVFID